MPSPHEILKQYWGFDHFKPLQEEIINNILRGGDTLALLPTGAGKSLCYQVPALSSAGFCLVVSPLIALMQDQVARLKEQDIMAAYVHAGMKFHDVERTFSNMVHGPYKLLYVSPERLQSELFQEFLPHFKINLVAVDEAHCISQWGYDFRPDYLKIAYLRDHFKETPFVALTASATQDVQQDIIAKLHLIKPAIFKQSIERKNIFYDVRYSENKNADVLAVINPNESNIIYCRSRKQTELVAKTLLSSGTSASPYHAGMSKEKRDAAQKAWMRNEKKVIVATTAFGMGIDKSDVRMVMHYDVPEHLEGYTQEAGRCGRDGQPATALTTYNYSDLKRLADSTALAFPNEQFLRQVYQSAVEYLEVPIGVTPDKYYSFDLGDFCKKFHLPAVPAARALKLLEQEGLWTLSESVLLPSTLHFLADRTVLDQMANTWPDLYYVCTGLLRLYGSMFQHPTPVRLSLVAHQLKMKQQEVEEVIAQLAKMEVIEYNKQEEGPQLYFHHYRVDSRHLIIDLERIHTLRKRHQARTDAMIRFLKNDTLCREAVLAKYFEEPFKEDCGHCDICRKKQIKTVKPGNIETALLQVLTEQGKANTQRMIDEFPTAIKEDVVSLIRKLIDERVLHLAPNGDISIIK